MKQFEDFDQGFLRQTNKRNNDDKVNAHVINFYNRQFHWENMGNIHINTY